MLYNCHGIIFTHNEALLAAEYRLNQEGIPFEDELWFGTTYRYLMDSSHMELSNYYSPFKNMDDSALLYSLGVGPQPTHLWTRDVAESGNY